MENLKEKTVLITGATSGIGKACAYGFARAGANLIVTARRIKLLEELAEELRLSFNIKVLCLKMDVRSRDEVMESMRAIPEQWQKIDILVNNAGLARGLNKFYEDEPDNWEDMVDTNIKGLLYVTHAVLPYMLRRQKGHIINIGSIAGHEAYPKGAVYCATKHAVDAITKSTRMDLLEKNIKVSSIDPGAVETNFSNIRFNGDTQRAKAVYKGLDPLVAEDIAETIIFMASRPWHVNLADVIIMPVAQASGTISYRRED